jgi:hypothetical protein
LRGHIALENGLSSPQLQKSLRFFTERPAIAAERFALYEDFRDSYNDVHCSGALQPRQAGNSRETAQEFQRLRNYGPERPKSEMFRPHPLLAGTGASIARNRR